MDNQIKSLYKQIKEGKMCPAEAAKQLKLVASRSRMKTAFSSNNTSMRGVDCSTGLDTTSLVDKVEAVLIKTVSKILKVKPEDIEIDTELSEYGFDSILLTELANQLNEKYNLELTPAIFFENPTLHSCAQYLAEEYKDMFAAYFMVPSGIEPSIPTTKGDELGISAAGSLADKVEAALVQTVSKLLKVKPEDIDIDSELSEYGFDSINLTTLVNQFNEQYKLELTPAIFFENPTIHHCAQYMAEEYRAVLEAHFTLHARGRLEVSAKKSPVEKRPDANRRGPWFAPVMVSTEQKQDKIANEPIAIVGISGIFPQARNVHEFWSNLVEGRNCIKEIPKERWDWGKYCDVSREKEGGKGIKWGALIDGADEFDPLFFRISPREAEIMDPQQRLMLMSVWSAVEDAGIPPSVLSQSPTGVFIAAGPGEYKDMVSIPVDDPLAPMSVVPSTIPNRISYSLNLRGPSEYCEAACSSTLVALHHAVQSIHCNECTQAIVGAVNLLLSPMGFIGFEAMGNLSPEGQSKSFQAEAGGYVRSEGVGAIIIKPLSKAVESRDHIYALIRGTGVVHGGKGISMTAPNPSGMKGAMIGAYGKAGIDPRTVSYIESNGVALPLSDAVEINALKSGYQELAAQYPQDLHVTAPCYISSLKPCIGHGEVVSGMAQLLKVIMAMRHRLIPGIPGFKTLHESISLKGTAFQISAENHNWEALTGKDRQELPRRASINSYGFGGVNAHVVLEEYLPSQQTVGTRPAISPQIVVFSARNRERLQAAVQQILDFIDLQKEISLSALAYTLQVGREAMECRIAMVANSIEELVQGMREYLQCVQKDCEIETSIPVFIGDQVDEPLKVNSLLNGKIGDTVVKMFLEERNLEKIALYWTQGGKIPWETLHEGEGVCRISLPTYPFERKRYWFIREDKLHSFRQNASLTSKKDEREADDGLTGYLKERISGLLGIPPKELQARKPLNRLGFSSIQAVTLRCMLEQDFGTEIPIVVVGGDATIEQLEGRLNEIIKPQCLQQLKGKSKESSRVNGFIKTEASEIIPQMVPNIADRYEPFPLNDIQEAFLTGRKLRFGGDWVGCHIYFEITVDELDIYRLNSAWEKLIAHHEMLRTIILSNGQQKIMEKTPPYKIKIADFRMKSDMDTAAHLEKVRENMAHKVYDTDRWPFFEIRISVCPGNKYIIHFSIDELILDASGVNMLLRQWQQLYEKDDWRLPKLEVSFRDYIVAVKKFEDSKRYKRDMEYWVGKLENMPQGPILSSQSQLGKPDSKDKYYRTRLNGSLEEKQWSYLKKKAGELNVSETSLLLGVFTEFLRIWSRQDEFSVILTYFNHLPLHPQLDQILGPFIATNIFVVEKKQGRNLEQLVMDNQRRLWDDLNHSNVSGIRVLRELKARHRISNSLFLPVVFTSLVNNFDTENRGFSGENFFKQISYMVTQTPQVYLDHQVLERDGKLCFSWDVAKGYFGADIIDAMFSDYCRFLQTLSEENAKWDLKTLVSDSRCNELTVKDYEEWNICQAPNVLNSVEKILPTDMELEVSEDNSFTPFPLTDQQQAYAFGRSKAMVGGNGNCQLYQEIDIEGLDIERLEKAWQKLLKIHEMLTTVIRSDGTQKNMEEVPEFKIRVVDLRGKKEEAVQAELSRIKHQMIKHVFNLDEWPYFDLRVSVRDSRIYRIHFSIDMLIADGKSIQLLLSQLFYLYEHFDRELKKAEITYRDYIISLQKYKKTPGYKRSIDYWENKFAGIPSGPQLAAFNNEERKNLFEHRQVKGVLDNWSTLRDAAERLRVSPGMILLTAYAEVLMAWSRNVPFSIVIPCWERLPLHQQIDEVVGDFTSMSWVVINHDNRTFEEKVRLNHKAVQEDLSHMAVSGLKALRKAVIRGGSKEKLAFPVVFTNLFTQQSVENPKGFKIGEKLSKTPHVYMDNISEERGEQLYFCWDVQDAVYPEGMVEEMFAGYRRVLEALAEDTANWDKINLNRLIDAKPEKYTVLEEDNNGRL